MPIGAEPLDGCGVSFRVWTPGRSRVEVVFEGNREPAVAALSPEEAAAAEISRRGRLIERAHPLSRSGPAAELVLAADQFLIIPAGLVEDAARAHAAGDELKTVIAGYHWFTD
nr:hypothetical protein [Tautonia sociabilis]